jgi:hypothetical protein
VEYYALVLICRRITREESILINTSTFANKTGAGLMARAVMAAICISAVLHDPHIEA